jgi:ABC-type Fe3+ transport system permease subunit
MLAWRAATDASHAAASLMITPPLLRFRRIWLPRHAGAITCALLFAFALALTEIEGSIMLSPPGRSSLGVLLYSMIHTAPRDEVAALAVAVLLLSIVPILPLLAISALRARFTNRRADV